MRRRRTHPPPRALRVGRLWGSGLDGSAPGRGSETGPDPITSCYLVRGDPGGSAGCGGAKNCFQPGDGFRVDFDREGL